MIAIEHNSGFCPTKTMLNNYTERTQNIALHIFTLFPLMIFFVSEPYKMKETKL